MDKHFSETFSFRTITPGIELLKQNFSLPRHRHLSGYATIVLSGALEEAGYAGRIQATAGDVLIHPSLDCHANHKVQAGVRLIRLFWSDPFIQPGLYHVDDLDQLAVVSEKCPADATLLLSELLRKRLTKSPRIRNDWPDMLAADLVMNVSTRIGDWARAHRLTPETVSRSFSKTYGVTPQVFKAECRARRAWLRITEGTDELSTVAAETGFADQAHMTHWIRRTTGASPGAWRRRMSNSPRLP